MNSIPCPLCGAVKFRVVFRDRGYDKLDYDLVKCDACGFCFINPPPTDQVLSDLYATYYGKPGDHLETASHLEFRRPVFEEIADLVEPFRKNEGNLLDIGCGNGDFLVMARSRGWKVTGIEHPGSGSDFARHKRGLNVVEGSFARLPFPPASFEAVTILDVLEHLRDPQTVLKSIHDVLKPGGVMAIRVPNTPFQFLKAKVQRWRRGPSLTVMAAPLHLNHFDAKNLSQAVRKSGFEIKSLGPGAADGAGATLFLKRAYVEMSKVLSHAGMQTGNILCLLATRS